jgi:outer membrane receptor protein involved in Fe transport
VQQRQYQIYETLTSTQGAHQIKTGGYAVRSDFDTRLRNNVDGRYLFNQDIPFSIANAASYPSQFIIFQGPRIGFKINSWSYGGFIQDSWQVTDALTLNAGVRYDFDQTNSAVNKTASTLGKR